MKDLAEGTTAVDYAVSENTPVMLYQHCNLKHASKQQCFIYAAVTTLHVQ